MEERLCHPGPFRELWGPASATEPPWGEPGLAQPDFSLCPILLAPLPSEPFSPHGPSRLNTPHTELVSEPASWRSRPETLFDRAKSAEKVPEMSISVLFVNGPWLLLPCQKLTNIRPSRRHSPGASTAREKSQRVHPHTALPHGAQLQTASRGPPGVGVSEPPDNSFCVIFYNKLSGVFPSGFIP